MSTALIRREEAGLTEIMTLGDVFKTSGYFRDVRDQSQAVVKILYGRELGFSPVISMMGIHVIEGKPALSSNLMGAMVKRSGKYNYRVAILNDKECDLEFTEDGKPVGTSYFSMEDAQRAGVVRQGSGWTKYPRNMLFARALSNGVKLFCPELSACPIYVPEELGAEVDEEGNVKGGQPPVETRAEPKQPVSFKKPKESVAANKGQDEQENNSMQLGNPEPTSQAAEKAVEVVESVPAPASTVEYIDREKQREFHAVCRGTVDKADVKGRSKVDGYTYQWLLDNGYLNEKGEPSASAIPVKDWPSAKDKAAKWVGIQR